MNRPTPYIVYNKIHTKAPMSSAHTGYVAATLDLTITLSESRKFSGAKNGDGGSLGVINEFDGPAMAIDSDRLKTIASPEAMPFKIAREWKGVRTLEAALANPVIGQDTGTQK